MPELTNRRVEKLRLKLVEKELDCFLVSQAENVRYLSGFDGSAGWLIITAHKTLLATDFRYVEQAGSQAPGFEVVRIKGDLADWLPPILADLKAKKIGFEAARMSFASHQRLAQKLGPNNLQLVSTEGIVESLRAIKEPEELELIARAIELSDAAYNHLLEVIRPGMTEKEAAWEVEKFMRERGSQSLGFEPIVASGANSALPHAKPTERRIQTGEPVIVDIGARVAGYTSDLSRTICLGDVDNTYARIYDIVLGAQLVAVATLEAGMTGEQVDRLARTVIEQAGYGDNFGHSLGHGVGLETHEDPRVGPLATNVIGDGMVFTVEPGIYVGGWGGVRIEDIVVVEKGKARLLSNARKVDHLKAGH